MNRPYPELDRLLADILNELDSKTRAPARPTRGPAEEESAGEALQNRRLSRRPSFRTPCAVHSVSVDGSRATNCSGMTRNLSAGGLGIIVNKEFSVGQAVEVRISLPERKEYTIGGTVTFCRPAAKGFHELGICLTAIEVRRLSVLHSIRKYLFSFWEREVQPAVPEQALQWTNRPFPGWRLDMSHSFAPGSNDEELEEGPRQTPTRD